MWKDKFSKALANVEKDEKNPKRKIENLVVFIIIVIICILVINNMWKTDSKKEDSELTQTAGRKLAVQEEEETQEKDTTTENLEAILAKIQRSRESKSNDYLFTN